MRLHATANASPLLSQPLHVPVNEGSSHATLLESKDILQGHKAIGILHNGALYRLQTTKLGKLILTK